MATPNQFPVRRNTFAQHEDKRLPGDSTSKAKSETPEPGDYRNTRATDAGGDLRRAIAENTRDQDDSQRATPGNYPRELVAVYTEPLALALPNEPQVGIILARIRNSPNDELPVSCGSKVDFVWDGVQSRAMITSIDGLVPDGREYKFNFLVVG
jgi:hypothetical protein